MYQDVVTLIRKEREKYLVKNGKEPDLLILGQAQVFHLNGMLHQLPYKDDPTVSMDCFLSMEIIHIEETNFLKCANRSKWKGE